MIALGNGDKLMSLKEVVERVREYMHQSGTLGVGDVRLLAAALDESPESVRNALKLQHTKDGWGEPQYV